MKTTVFLLALVTITTAGHCTVPPASPQIQTGIFGTVPPASANSFAPSATGYGTCSIDAHRHTYVFDASTLEPQVIQGLARRDGSYEPDIIMDGLCHDNTDESIVKDDDSEDSTGVSSRQKLPKVAR